MPYRGEVPGEHHAGRGGSNRFGWGGFGGAGGGEGNRTGNNGGAGQPAGGGAGGTGGSATGGDGGNGNATGGNAVMGFNGTPCQTGGGGGGGGGGAVGANNGGSSGAGGFGGGGGTVTGNLAGAGGNGAGACAIISAFAGIGPLLGGGGGGGAIALDSLDSITIEFAGEINGNGGDADPMGSMGDGAGGGGGGGAICLAAPVINGAVPGTNIRVEGELNSQGVPAGGGTFVAHLIAPCNPDDDVTVPCVCHSSGTTITFTLRNDSPDSIYLVHSEPFEIRDAGGQVVFRPACTLPVVIEIPAGQTHEFTWDQTDDGDGTIDACQWNNAAQVPNGDYTFAVSFCTDADCGNQSVRCVDFQIGDCAVGCCLPDGTCIDTDPNCCLLEGGTPHSAGPCNPPEGCCLPDDTCIDTDPECCVQMGGMPHPGPCNPPEGCCLPDGTCFDADPECCVEMGGTPTGAPCGPSEACCLPDGSCVDADPLCCALQGGTSGGAGSFCGVPEACCLPDGGCDVRDPLCCRSAGGEPQGAGSACGSVVVTTDKDCYTPGEKVTLTTTTNNSCARINLRNGGPWEIKDNQANHVFNPACVTLAIIPLEPGESHSFEWDQLDEGTGQVGCGYQNRAQVANGIYQACVAYTNDNFDPDQTSCTTFRVSTNCISVKPECPCSMPDAVVKINITNRLPTTIFLPYEQAYRIKTPAGALVFQPPPAPPFSLPVSPGQTHSFFWGQIDLSGEPALPGEYRVEIDYAFGDELHTARGRLKLGACLELTLDQDCYGPGTDVKVKIVNRSCEQLTLTLMDRGPLQFVDAQGSSVYALPCVENTTMEPGEMRTWTWDQTDEGDGTFDNCQTWNRAQPIGNGRYCAQVHYADIGITQAFLAKRCFDVGNACADLAADKGCYERGADVCITLTNNTGGQITVDRVWRILDSGGNEIHPNPPTCNPFWIPPVIADGGSHSFCWDQNVCFTPPPVGTGTYTMEVHFVEADGTGHTYRQDFDIVADGACPIGNVPAVSGWRTLLLTLLLLATGMLVLRRHRATAG